MPTRHRGPLREIRALNAYITLMRAAESVTARTAGPMTAAGLTVSQFGALEALLHLGPMHQSALSKKLLKSTGNVVMVVGNLERRRLVERRRDPRDRRRLNVRLTAPGRSLARRVFPRVLAAIVKEMGTLSASRQECLRDLCRALGKGKAGNMV